MTADRKRNLSLLSAGLLAVLTLGVFVASPNRGPASAVIRFNEAIRRQDGNMLQAVTLGDAKNQDNQLLQSLVARLLANGGTCRVTRIEREKGYALVYTVYSVPKFGLHERVFVAKYVPPVWLIDAGLTLSLKDGPGGS